MPVQDRNHARRVVAFGRAVRRLWETPVPPQVDVSKILDSEPVPIEELSCGRSAACSVSWMVFRVSGLCFCMPFQTELGEIFVCTPLL